MNHKATELESILNERHIPKHDNWGFVPIYLTGAPNSYSIPDYLVCVHCGQRVESGLLNWSPHRSRCPECVNPANLDLWKGVGFYIDPKEFMVNMPICP